MNQKWKQVTGFQTQAEKEAIFQAERRAAIDVHVPGQAGFHPGRAQPNPVQQPKSKRADSPDDDGTEA
jgi:hypothetical protein